MKFYIVNNGSLYFDKIIDRIAGHQYEEVMYTPYTKLDPKDADIIILSGGMQNEVKDYHKDGLPWYRHEFELIQNSKIPILGICLGLQMTVVALGGTLKTLNKLVDTNKLISLNKHGTELLNSSELYVHEKHQFIADDISKTGLKVLATSNDGVEIIYHPQKNIIATQFHPEVDTNTLSEKLFWDLITLVTKSRQNTSLKAKLNKCI